MSFRAASLRRAFPKLIATFAALAAIDGIRLAIHINGAFTDGFEAVVATLCMVAVAGAAIRSPRPERTLWALVATFFAFLLLADLHDLIDAVARPEWKALPALELFGWLAYLPLAFLCVAPAREDDASSPWHAIPLLDFLQASLVLSVAYYSAIYVPHAVAQTSWRTFGQPDLMRDVFLTAGTLIRAAVEIRPQSRRIFGWVGVMLLLRTASRLFLQPWVMAFDVLVRPMTYMMLAVVAARWGSGDGDDARAEAPRRRQLPSQWLFGVLPAGAPVFVAIFAERHPENAPFLWPLFWFSLAVFGTRTAIAEYERLAAARLRDVRERQLSEAESRFRTVSEHAQVGIAVLVDGRIRYANPALARIAGRDRADLLGAEIAAFAHPADRAAVEAAMLRVQSGAVVTLESEVRGLRPDGEIRRLTVNGGAAHIDGEPAVVAHVLDITERTRAEKALHRKGAEMLRLLDNFVDAFLQTDEQGKLTLVSASAARMFGFDSTEEMIGFDPVRLYADPRTREEIMTELRACGSVVDRQALARRKDGTTFWVSLSMKRFIDDRGLVGNHGVIRDISERMAAEERTRLLSVMLDEAPAGIVVHGDDGETLYANKGAAALHGYSREAFARLRIADLVDAGEVASIPARIDLVKTERSATFEVLCARKDDSNFPVEVRAKRVEWLGRPAILSVETDLTGIRQAEASRAASERLAQATIDALKAHICVLDANGTILAVNRAWRRFAESNPPAPGDAFLGANYLATCDAAEGPEAAEAKSIADGIRAVVAGRRDELTLEYACHSPAQEHWFSASVTRYDAGTPVRIVVAHWEITERRHAEEAMRASAQRHQLLIEHLHAGVVVHAPDTSIVLANRQACDALGFSTDAITGKTAMDPAWSFLRENGTSMPVEEFPVTRVLATRQPVVNVVIGVDHADPRGRSWALVNAFPFLDAQHEISEIVVTFVDITEQQETQERLAASEKRLAAALDVAQLGAYEYGEDFRIISMDSRMRAICGVEETDDPRKVWGERIDPQDRWAIEEMTAKVEDGGVDEATVEYRYLHPERGTIWLRHAVAVLARDAAGRMTSQIGVVSDVTEQKRADEQLRASQERFSAFMSNLPAAAFVKDLAGRTLFANDFLRTRIDFAKWETTAGATAVDGMVLPVGPLKTEKPMIDIRGVPRTFETITFPIVVNGEASLVGGIAIDVTERKSLETQLLHAQKMEAVGRLASGVAHDFNNILQAMLMTSQVLRVKEQGSQKVQKTVAEYETLIKRATGLTRQLLLFSRQETARHELVDVRNLVHDLTKMVRRLVRENITLTVERAPEPLVIGADPSQIDQVIMNLVVNASDAMPEGGKLTIRTSAIDRQWASLEIEDTGHGISPAVRERIFEPFFTTKAAGHGTGLGLAVVHGIVTTHGGRIEVESTIGKGTRFRIMLPRKNADHPQDLQRPLAAAEPAPRRGARILVVEDNIEARETMGELLTSLGYQVVTVGSGEEAVLLPDEPRFDLLLSDVILPGISGLILARQLVARWPELKFILMSGYIGDEVTRSTVATADVRFLQKPFDLDALEQQVTAALRE
jgi:two-component system cell cycle sensor histidine kinase/response regulator CckA